MDLQEESLLCSNVMLFVDIRRRIKLRSSFLTESMSLDTGCANMCHLCRREGWTLYDALPLETPYFKATATRILTYGWQSKVEWDVTFWLVLAAEMTLLADLGFVNSVVWVRNTESNGVTVQLDWTAQYVSVHYGTVLPNRTGNAPSVPFWVIGVHNQLFNLIILPSSL